MIKTEWIFNLVILSEYYKYTFIVINYIDQINNRFGSLYFNFDINITVRIYLSQNHVLKFGIGYQTLFG